MGVNGPSGVNSVSGVNSISGVNSVSGLSGVSGVNRQRPAAPSAIRVDIGELVLDGFHADPDRVSAAFEHELTRLVRESGVPLAADGTVGVDALTGLPPLPAGLSARRLGQELARAVHQGLSGQGEVTR